MIRIVIILVMTLSVSGELAADIVLFQGNQKKSENHFLVDGQPIDSLFQRVQSMVYHHPDDARKITMEAIKIAQELQQYEWEIRLLNLIGSAYAIKSEYNQALAFYHQALERASEKGSYTRLGARPAYPQRKEHGQKRLEAFY